jgi:hypothetical protein
LQPPDVAEIDRYLRRHDLHHSIDASDRRHEPLRDAHPPDCGGEDAVGIAERDRSVRDGREQRRVSTKLVNGGGS